MEYTLPDYTHSAPRLDRPSEYLLKKARQRHNYDQLTRAMGSRTVYIGNLSFFTTEEQVYELLSKCGEIDRIVMGLDRFLKTPCGFCFVIYTSAKSALDAVKILHSSRLDDKPLEIDLDPGFIEGRQFGRGLTGGQVRDEVAYNMKSENGSYGQRGGFRGRRKFVYRGASGGRGGRGSFRGGRDSYRGGRGGYRGGHDERQDDTYIPSRGGEVKQDDSYRPGEANQGDSYVPGEANQGDSYVPSASGEIKPISKPSHEETAPTASMEVDN